MRFGLYVGIYGEFADPRILARLAQEAEAVGWDGFFIWDHIATATPPGGVSTHPEPLVDPWIAMAAIAMSTQTIRFGPMVTPLPRRRPWKLARETVSLDHLSNGRLILPVGSGAPFIIEEEFAQFGEETDARVRAAKLDEGLDVLAGLWSGTPFHHDGVHYQVRGAMFLPRPIQSPRIPIWVAATWPHRAPFRRAARWDGVRIAKSGGPLTPGDVREIVAYTGQHRVSAAPFDVVIGGVALGDDPATTAAVVASFAEAGATWMILGTGPREDGLEGGRRQIRQGPPRGV